MERLGSWSFVFFASSTSNKYEKYYTVHVTLQMLIVVKSVTAALTVIPREPIWLLLAKHYSYRELRSGKMPAQS